VGLLALISFILLVVSLVLPWYYQEIKGSAKGIGSCEIMTYTYWDTQRTECGTPCAICISGEVKWNDDCEASYCTNRETVYNSCRILVAIATTAIGLSFVVMILRFYLDYRISVWIPHLLVFGAFVLALGAIMAFSLALPSATRKDLVDQFGASGPCEGPCAHFAGSGSVTLPGLFQASSSWGPTSGWLVGLVAVFVLLVLFVLLSVPHFRTPYERID